MNVLPSLKYVYTSSEIFSIAHSLYPKKAYGGLEVHFYSSQISSLDGASCFGHLIPDTRYLVGWVGPTASLDNLKEVIYSFLLQYFWNQISYVQQIFRLSLVAHVPVFVLDAPTWLIRRCQSSLEHRAYNNYLEVCVLCVSIWKISGKNLQPHIKENGISTLVTEFKSCFLFYSRRLCALCL
jgi:hypothetical protein